MKAFTTFYSCKITTILVNEQILCQKNSGLLTREEGGERSDASAFLFSRKAAKTLSCNFLQPRSLPCGANTNYANYNKICEYN